MKKNIYTWYNGTPKGNAFSDNTKDATFTNLPVWFYLLLIITLVVFLSMIIFLASWLKGSKWINKKNTYINGEKYIRTKGQTIIFRVLIIIIALSFLSSFFVDAINGDIIADPVGGWDILESMRDYIFGLGWYYQCFLSSLLIGIALLFKKYNFMLIVWPIAFIGALRTFADVSDLTENMNYTSFNFYRFFFEHMMLIFMPIFIAVSQRQRYTIKRIFSAAAFTFMMVFVAYILQALTISSDATMTSMAGYGEISGVGEWFGFEQKWIVNNIHIFFWGILLPFGLLVTFVIISVFQFFSIKSTLTKYSWGKRWVKVWPEIWKTIKIDFKDAKNGRFIKFFSTNHPSDKRKFIPYGVKEIKSNKYLDIQEHVYLHNLSKEYMKDKNVKTK